MIFGKIINGIKEAFMVSGYARAAKELMALSDRQLADIGVSRELLKRGISAYPWRETPELVAKPIPSNVTTLNTSTNVVESAQDMPKTPKAA